jgi:nucleoside-diphosphate-sugar epimerase
LALLAARPEFSARGMVRKVGPAADALQGKAEFVVGDVTDRDSLVAAMTGMDAVILLTSAVPVMDPPVEGAPPSFSFAENGMPELVDWEGGKAQIDVAVECGVKKFVFVGYAFVQFQGVEPACTHGLLPRDLYRHTSWTRAKPTRPWN